MSYRPVSELPKPIRMILDVIITGIGGELILYDWHKHPLGVAAGVFIAGMGVVLFIVNLIQQEREER
jgi:hypothetical protein